MRISRKSFRVPLLLYTTLALNPGINADTSVDFSYLISFGDSYTANLFYKVANSGEATAFVPPVNTGSGDKIWGDIIHNMLPAVTHYDYAISGAVCASGLVTGRSIVLDDELPNFLQGWQYKGSAGLYKSATPDNTVFALWVGTNDLYAGFFSGNKNETFTLPVLVDCYWTWIDRLYKNGARRFVVLTPPPLYLAPLSIMTDAAMKSKARQFSSSVTRMTAYGASYESTVKRWPGATVMVYDTHQFMTDMHYNKDQFFESPSSVTISYNKKYSLDHFMWYNDLHPSNRTHTIIAKEFITAMTNGSQYASFYKS